MDPPKENMKIFSQVLMALIAAVAALFVGSGVAGWIGQ
jgi:hypothetical protein